MPPKRKRYASAARRSKRMFRKPCRVARRRFMRGRSLGDKVHQFQQNASSAITSGVTTLPLNNIISAGNTSAGFVYTPALQDVGQASTFAQLYDQYKLWKVTFRFRLITNPGCTATLNANTTNESNWFPTLWLVPDHDDSSTPALFTIKEYSRVKSFIMRPNRWIRYSIHPNVLTQLYDGAVTTAYKVDKPGSTWVDMSQLAVPHYGLKAVVDFTNLSTAASFNFQIEAKYYFACKCIR